MCTCPMFHAGCWILAWERAGWIYRETLLATPWWRGISHNVVITGGGGGGYKPYRRIVKSTSHFLLNICEVSRLNRITWNKWKNFVFLRFCVGRKYFTLHEVLSKCTVLVLLGACSLDFRRQKKNCWTWIDNAGLYYIMVVCNVDHLLLWVHEVVPVRRWNEIFRSWKVSMWRFRCEKVRRIFVWRSFCLKSSWRNQAN